MKEGRKAGVYSALAAACFSSAIVFHDVTVNATIIGVSMGTVAVLAAAFFAGKKEAK